MPLFFPDHRALAFGDAVIGIEGKLRVWQSVNADQERWYRERFIPTLRPLLDLDVERVLVTHGPPVVEGGRRELAEAFEAGPVDDDRSLRLRLKRRPTPRSTARIPVGPTPCRILCDAVGVPF